VTVTYILVGDSQGVGMRSHLRTALAAHDHVELGAAVRVGIQVAQHIQGRGPKTQAERNAGVTARLTPLDPTASQLAARNPGLIIVVLGGNDRQETAAYTRLLHQLVDLLRPSREGAIVPIIWAGPAVVRVTDHPAAFYQIPRNRRLGTRSAAESAQNDIWATKQRIARVQQSVLPTLEVQWLDGFAMTRIATGAGPGRHARDGLHLNRAGSRSWAQQISRQVRSLNLPPSPDPPDGSHIASLAQRGENNSINNETRSRIMQGTPRAGLYDSSNINTSARQTARAAATSRRVDISQRDLRIPVIVNALGFDFRAESWGTRISTNSSATAETAAETPVRDTTVAPAPSDDDDSAGIDGDDGDES